MHVLTVSPSAVDPSTVATVVNILESGGVVALPTETVYGLCCRSNQKQAIERVYQMKGRAREKPLPYLISDRDQVLNFVNTIPRMAEKLMDRFWPGPLTLVIGPGDGVALRLPDHEFTRSVLRTASGPIMGTSANRSGEKPATTARRVQRYFETEIDLLVDAGKSRLGTESTVVRVDDNGRLEILRAGQIGDEAIQAVAARSILIVCTGNTCRSPMAAASLRHALALHLGVEIERLERAGFRVLSAGIAAFPGSPMTREAHEALRDAGIPEPGDHRSRPLTQELIIDADLIFAMTEEHRRALREQFQIVNVPVLLLDPTAEDIADPIGGPPIVYERALRTIQASIESRLPEIIGEQGLG